MIEGSNPSPGFFIMKILIHKGKKAVVEGREYTVSKQKKYFVADTSKDFHTEFGIISKKDLQKKSGTIKTNKGKEFAIFEAKFLDQYQKIKRLPQIIPLKDLGFILAQTGVDKKSKVVDAGGGSGGLSLFLANLVKEVTTYEINKDCIPLIKDNIKFLDIKNITLKEKSIYDGISEKDVDLITLDLPEPWKAIKHAEKALKVGGFLVNYSPHILSTSDFVNETNKSENFIHIKTIEVIEKEWEVDGRKLRPKSRQVIHSGFLSFFRKIRG